MALQAAARGASITRLALFEPAYVSDGGQPRTYEAVNARLDQLLAAGDRAGAVRFVLTEVMGVPRPFAFVMPLFMRNTWKKNEAVAHTLKYDLTLLSDWSVLQQRHPTVPTLAIGGEKSPQSLREAVAMVAAAIQGAHTQILAGQNHNLAPTALTPVVNKFFLGN